MTYEEELKLNESYLDKIDFLPYFNKYDEVRKLMIAVEDDYDGTELCNDEFMCGCIFNCMDRYDVAEYLSKRYTDWCFREPDYYEPPIYIWRKKDEM